MSHKNEAVAGAARIQAMDVSDNFHAQTGEHKADIIAYYQLKATLALVEAQEGANELKRIEMVMKVLQFAINNDFEDADWAIAAGKLIVNEKDHTLTPDVARALGIEVAE